MKNYFTIFGLLFKYMFKKNGEKTSRWIWLAYGFIALAFGFMIVMICAMVSTFAAAVNSLDLLPEFLTAVLAIGCVAVLIFGIIPMLNYLYFSRDTEFMMMLPVKPSTVFMAKLSVVYLTEIIVSTLVLIPCMITIGVTLGLNAVFYIVSVLSVLLVPVVPLVLIAIIAIPLMYVVSFFKNKGALTSVVLILLFGLIFGAYYYFIFNFSNGMADGEEIDPAVIIGNFTSLLMTLSKILFPLAAVARLATLSDRTMFGEFSVGAAAGINLAVFVASVVVLLTLAVVVSAMVYKRGARSMLEGGGRKNNAKIEFKSSGSARKALFAKEWKELFRTPAFAFQALSGVILCPLVVVFMSGMFSMGAAEGMEEGEVLSPESIALMKNILGYMLIGFISFMGVSMNIGAATTITREGGNFHVAKTIPVPYREQIMAKLMLYVLISSVTIVISLIISAFFGISWWMLILGAVFLLLYNYGYNCFCVYIDLNRPKLNWTTPNEAVKNNRNAIMPMFVNMGISAILIIIPVVCQLLIPSLLVASIISWVVLLGIAVAAAIVFHNMLFANVDRLFEKING